MPYYLVSFNNNVDFVFNKTGSNKKIGLVVKVIDSSEDYPLAGNLIEIYDVNFPYGNNLQAGQVVLASIGVKNIGHSTEEDVYIKMSIPSLGVSQRTNKFDLVTMSFSLRNVENIKTTLNEINRVLKKNGQFLCLEFGKIKNLTINSIYKIYSENFIPELGKNITGNKEAYKYFQAI